MAQADNDDDTRDRERIDILGELVGEVMIFQPMAIKQISHGGAQVETSFPLLVDSLHDFRLMLGDRSIIVKGRVAHCQITDVEHELVLYRSGIEFTDPSEHAQAVITDFVNTIKASRRGF
jgi:hypothetical protein